MIEDAISFITKNKPQKDDLILIIKKTIENLPGKGRVKLSDREQRKVIESVVLFYIDKVYYESEKPFFGKQLSKFLATIDNRKLNRRKLFELWNSEDAKNFENKIPPDQIRDILIGK